MRPEQETAEKCLDEIAAAIRQSGLDPYAQITGFLRTGNDAYITRTNGARYKIKCVDTEEIRTYLNTRLK